MRDLSRAENTRLMRDAEEVALPERTAQGDFVKRSGAGIGF
jgi:hypothetical protein